MFSQKRGIHFRILFKFIVTVFRRNLNDWELEIFCQLLQLLESARIDHNKEDNLICVSSKGKRFPVKISTVWYFNKLAIECIKMTLEDDFF